MYWSIVCPTMWRGGGLKVMIEQQKLLDNPDVKELLLIDNDPSKTINWKHPKLKVIHRGNNIFVNPAWNWGVKNATTDHIVLLSDDIVFDPSVFSQLRVNPNAGIIGLGEGCDKGQSGTITPRKYIVHPCLYPYTHYEQQFAMLMLMHKKAFLPIPEEAKIYLGDVWLYDYNNHRNVRNYFINNLDVIMQRGATSSSPDLIDIGVNELKNSHEFYHKYRGLFTLTTNSVKLSGQ